MHVTVLVPGHGVTSTVVGPLEVFGNAGVIWQQLHHAEETPNFFVETASEDGLPVAYPDGIRISPDHCVDDIEQTDIVFVPTVGMDIDSVLATRPRMLRFIKHHASRGSVIAGVCTGVSFLAEAGILDGRPGTTHWALVESFRERYPKVDWQPERFITESERVFCGGGVYAALDLCLHLVERFSGYEASRQCGRAMLIDPPRTWQASFSEPMFNQHHQDEDIHKVQDFMAHHFGGPLTVSELAQMANMSPRNFSRRFRVATGEAPLSYLHKLRIDCAKHLLEVEHKPVSEISYEVGYEDVPHFRQLFKRHTGLTPTEYRERFVHRPAPQVLVEKAV